MILLLRMLIFSEKRFYAIKIAGSPGPYPFFLGCQGYDNVKIESTPSAIIEWQISRILSKAINWSRTNFSSFIWSLQRSVWFCSPTISSFFVSAGSTGFLLLTSDCANAVDCDLMQRKCISLVESSRLIVGLILPGCPPKL